MVLNNIFHYLLLVILIIKKTRFDHQISKILSQEEITPKDFFIKEMQEVSSEGGFRQAAIHCSDYLSEKQ